MSKDERTLKDFMPAHIRSVLGNQPTTHQNCMEATKSGLNPDGIARPGKTARDRSRNPQKYNRV